MAGRYGILWTMKTTPKKSFAALAALLILSLTLSACGAGMTAKAYDLYGYFGTQSAVVVYADYNDKAAKYNVDAAVAEIEAVFAALDGAVSLSDANSDVSRFNAAAAGATLEISAVTYEILTLAKELYDYTDGAYDPAVGLLVDLWGFTPRFNDFDYAPTRPYDRASQEQLPDEKYIDAFRSLTGFGGVALADVNGKYYVTKPTKTMTVAGDDTVYTMAIDLGGIGKGLAADKARSILAEHGLTEAYVSVGTSSLSLLASGKDAAGAPAKGMWSVSLAHPRGGAPYLSVYARDTAASTSGDYEHAYEVDGVNYCHIIDPATGRPITSGTATVSLFGRTAAAGDALTTALCVMGRDKAIAFINENLTDCRVAMVCAEGDGYGFLTNMDEAYYKLNGTDFPVLSRAADGRLEYVG